MGVREISNTTPKEALTGERKVHEVEFPTDPEERMAALLASINAAPKSLVLVLLPGTGYLSSRDLARLTNSIASQTDMERLGSKNVTAYLKTTLVPIGLVAQEYIIESFGHEETVGFGLTEDGLRHGVPAACLALSFENKHNVSIYPVLGQTGTSSPDGMRAPHTRSKILQLLQSKGGSLREVDIIAELNIIQSVVQQSLMSLNRAGVIDYNAVTEKTDIVLINYRKGKTPKEKVKTPRGEAMLTKEIILACDKLSAASLPITSAAIMQELSESVKKGVSDARAIRGRIARITLNLSRQGYLSREDFEEGAKSTAKINELGRKLVKEFIEPLQEQVSMNEDKILVATRLLVHQVLSDIDRYGRKSLNLYYPHSTGKKHRDAELNKQNIYESILMNPGISVRELSVEVGYNPRSVWKITQFLEKEGRIKSNKLKGVRYCFPA